MQVTPGERILGIIGYLPVLFLIPVKIKKDSMFAQFHGRQSGVLFLTWIVLSLVFFLSGAFIKTTDATGQATGGATVQTILFGIVFLITAVYAFFMLAGMFKVALGERYRMPVIADIALLLRL